MKQNNQNKMKQDKTTETKWKYQNKGDKYIL